MSFPVGMEGISRAVNSWTQLSRWNDERPVVRYELLRMGNQGRQTDMNSVTCCWDDCNPAGDLRHEGHCRHELVCIFSCVIPTPECKIPYCTWKLPYFRSLPGATASIFWLWVNTVFSKKVSFKQEPKNSEDSLFLWNRIRGLFL